ncbi:DUF4270 family protein [Hymenobacter negativus]|uniref:DUF4270 family protein n=1 Tax=Hymenobacter negativus TaxID=2795026 RepID=A0ABS3QBF5_9BACT|nr:DUF4270 family protein [Hymenobacter negativus]MBO2008497.1 DUF4270 family protein [Hymenobacter negativus]
MNWLTSRGAPLVAFVALALTGCDTGTALNVDLPDTTSVNTQYQDLPLSASTVRLAPVHTLKTDHYLVGCLEDNVAGKTTANAYLNVLDAAAITAVGGSVTDSLPSTVATPAAPAVIDSVVMVMGFDQVYGSTTTPARFDIYQLQAPLDDRQVYDASMAQPATVIATNVASRLNRTQQVIVTAAVAATNTTAAIPAVTSTASDPTVRLLLRRRAAGGAITEVPSPYIDGIFTQLTQAGFKQSTLNGLLKGLAIKPNTTYRSGIVAFSRGYRQRMIFYYHTDATTRRSYSFYFGPVFSSLNLSGSSDPRYYTEIKNEFPTNLLALDNRTGSVNPSVLNGLSYAQEGTGLATRISFTGLSDLIAAATTGGLTINRAEIRVPVKPYTNALFQNPNLLYGVEVDASNNVLQRVVNFIPTDRVVQADGTDQTGVGSYAAGGLVDALTNQAYYSLPITSYLQAYLYDKLGGNPTALVLAPSIQASSTLTLNRAALDAANIKLRVYYSKR